MVEIENLINKTATLNEEGLRIYKGFEIRGPAGSGKTHTLINLTSKLILKNNSVCCITYTNAAKDEILSRYSCDSLDVYTIHQFLWRTISGFTKEKVDVILDLSKKNEYTNLFTKASEVNYSSKIVYDFGYESFNDDTNVYSLSHDAMIVLASEMIRRYPLLSKMLDNKYDFLFVDEYQDSSKIFIESLLSVDFSNLIIGFFGDPLQNIYSDNPNWYQNTVGDIRNLGGINSLSLNINYRSSEKITNFINKIRSDGVVQRSKSKFKDYGSTIRIVISENPLTDDFINTLSTGIERYKILHLTHKLRSNNREEFDNLHLRLFNQDAENTLYEHWSLNNTRRLSNNNEELHPVLRLIYEIINFKQDSISEVYFCRNVLKVEPFCEDEELLPSRLTEIKEDLDFIYNSRYIKEVKEVLHKYIHSSALVESYFEYSELFEKHSILYKGEEVEFMDATFDDLMIWWNLYRCEARDITMASSKGLEYDNVIVNIDTGDWWAREFNDVYNNDIDINKCLYYTACSRARKNLVIYVRSSNVKCKFFYDNLPSELKEIVEFR